MNRFLRATLTLLFISGIFVSAHAQDTVKPNFIFIVIDDLNDYVEGLTDQPQIATPNILSLEAAGTTFINGFANNPGCAPSRTSFFSGKDIDYTKVYNNDDYISKFRDNFTVAENNSVVYTIPEILKDSGGYFTFGINKLFHNPNENDYDKTVGTPMCEKEKSWNRMSFHEDVDTVLDMFHNYSFGNFFDWGMIPDSLEYLMEDYMGADTAIQFIHDYADSAINTCGDKPFFLGLGFFRPHTERYIPAKYFPPYFMSSVYNEPYVIPYNDPVGNVPYNGLVMPPQPDTIYQDYYDLPEGGIGRSLADNGKVYEQITDFVGGLAPLPEIDPALTDSQRSAILFESVNADYSMAYIAAVQFVDAQIGRVMDALDAHPELKANTIIVLIGDNGYSLGEKKHWTKWSMWDTDLRIPFIIVDPSIEAGQKVEVPVTPLDLFPTICDMADVNYPDFPDGTRYLDGSSLLPLLNAPASKFEFPALSTYRQNATVGSCFSLYSVRNDRFHYIRYRDNNDGTFPTTYCDSSYVHYEEELYEVGANRETDPYEWNNLISNDDYYPVINFLQQWITDSILYKQKTFKPYVHSEELPCFAAHNDTLHLSFDLYDTTGVMIAPPDHYTYRWSTNLSDDTWTGVTADINLSVIPDAVFDVSNRMMVYLEMIDSTGTIVAGFDLQYYYVNEANIPDATFNVMNTEGLTVCVQDYNINGTYTDSWWDFGDGFTSDEFIPGAYTYPAIGTYTVTNYVEYGNDSCVAAFTQNITLNNANANPAFDIHFYPNPVSDALHITFPGQLEYATLSVYDLTGRKVDNEEFLGNTCSFSCSVDVSGYTNGMYLFQLQGPDAQYTGSFVVVHP